MPQYSCELCKKEFKQKCDFERHKDKKNSCLSNAEVKQHIEKNTEKKETKTAKQNEFNNMLKSCLNILRDNEGLTGDKALRNLSYLLVLKLIEPHFDNKTGEIKNIDDYDFGIIENIEHHNKLLSIMRFSKLAEEKDENIPNNIGYLWNDILSVHPSTKNIFLKDKSFDIQRASTFRKLITKINTIKLQEIESDVLGEAYEEVIQDIMTGKVLGQFFTPLSIKKMMVNLINPQVHADGKIETCGDPTMGTGGFLIDYLKYIIKQAETRNIKLDWDFIKTEGLYGKELEPDTYQLAMSNMLISSGHMFEQLDRGDSIREPITRKFDNILANPPFGIKGLRYDDFQNPLKSEYVPIKTDNAVSLFIQAIIHMLKINGKCAVVLPDGQDLFSKTNTTLVAIREYLMKTCDLKEIIYLPSGIFTYTSIKTCVFYFVKKREGTDVLETKIKVSKTQKETGRDYKFSKTHQTTKVKFYDYNPYEDVKNLLVEVPIEKIVSNSYSLNYSEYMKDETDEEQYEDGVVVKTLGEVCKFDIGGTPSRSKNEYYENGNNLWVSVRELNGGYIYDTKEKITDLGVQNSSVKLFAKDTILFSFKLSIGKTAIVGNPLYTNEAIAGLLSKNNDLNNKYLYYYLTINDFSKLGSGILGNGSLNKKSLEQIKIPIPSLERQKEIVEYCEYNDKLIKNLEKEIENNKKQAQQFIRGIIKTQVDNDYENLTTQSDNDDEKLTSEKEDEYNDEELSKTTQIDEEDEYNLDIIDRINKNRRKINTNRENLTKTNEENLTKTDEEDLTKTIQTNDNDKEDLTQTDDELTKTTQTDDELTKTTQTDENDKEDLTQTDENDKEDLTQIDENDKEDLTQTDENDKEDLTQTDELKNMNCIFIITKGNRKNEKCGIKTKNTFCTKHTK